MQAVQLINVWGLCGMIINTKSIGLEGSKLRVFQLGNGSSGDCYMRSLHYVKHKRPVAALPVCEKLIFQVQ